MVKISYLTHYYHKDQEPFRTLSALPDADAIRIMRSLIDDTPFGARFKNPEQYLRERRATEVWVRVGFIAKGGKPKDAYPISMVLGESPWMVENLPDREKHGEIRLPISLFTRDDVSFTYPDSMISYGLSRDKPAEFYQSGLHGIIFTLDEISDLVEARGLPEGNWETSLPDHLAPYIEAQVWNLQMVRTYWQRLQREAAPFAPE